jgi:hypothetical protein
VVLPAACVPAPPAAPVQVVFSETDRLVVLAEE